MVASDSSWLDLFRGENGLRVAVLVGGTGLHAVNVFVGATLLPSVVAEIGGLDLFAWNTTLFIVASILASVFAATRPFGIGPRACYVVAASAFGLGSFVCGSAPDMLIMLAGRAIQGFGAGLLVAMGYAMIRVVFPPALWPRAMALISGVWGVATLIGPALGGVFAELGIWRWAFWSLLPFAALLGVLVFRVIPTTSDERGMSKVPGLQILLIVGAVLLVSVASVVVANNTVLAATLVGAAVIAVLGLVAAERRGTRRLLPSGAFHLRTPLSALLIMLLLMPLGVTADVFIPLFLQRLHGMSPLMAGYFVALVALGWTTGSLITSGWTGPRAKTVMVGAPVMMALAMVLVGLLLGQPNPAGDWSILGPMAVALFVMGMGIGSVWPHILTRTLHAAPAGENDLTSAAITMVQLFAGGLGAALAGVTVNLTGLVHAQTPEAAAPAAIWLLCVFALAPLLTAPVALRVSRRPVSASVVETAP